MFRSLDTNADGLVDLEDLCSAVAAELSLASLKGSFAILSIAMHYSFMMLSSEIKV